jgi:imidazolonepropionase-like amidohydrolase
MILIKGGNIHDGKGNILKEYDLLISNGKIEKIDVDIKIKNQDTEIIDAKGKEIFPGFIESLNVWGAIGPGWKDDDLKEVSNPVTPELNVKYSFDHDSMNFQRVFEYGVTAAGITPTTSNVIGGQSSVYKTFGSHPYKMIVKEDNAMIASVTSASKKIYGPRKTKPMTKMGAFSLLREALIKAEKYDGSKGYDAKNEAMKKVLGKEMPLFINVNTKAEIDAVELALREFDIDIVYTGAFGIDKEAGKVLEKKNKVILGDLTNAMSYVNKEVDFDSIKELLDKDIEIAISSCGDLNASGKESLLWNAILAHKYGLDSEEVLKMITSIPAKILKVDDKIGTLEEGKEADLSIWTDNPIKRYDAKIEKVYLNGEDILKARRDKSCW